MILYYVKYTILQKMKRARGEVGANVAESQSSQGIPNRSLQEMALTNYIIVRQIICHLSYLDTVNLCEASEDIMKMVGSKISYMVISLPIHDLRDPEPFIFNPGCTCEMFSANVEERTIGYKKSYKISLVKLLDQLKKSGRENFKLSLRIFIPDLSMEFIQRHGEQLISFFTEFGLHVEEFNCSINYEDDEQNFQYFIRCLQIFRNLRVLRFTSSESFVPLEIPVTHPEIPICLFKLTTIYLVSNKARTDFFLSIAPNLQKIFDFPMDHISLLSKYNAGTKVKTVVRNYRWAITGINEYNDDDVFFAALANAGVKLESPFLNSEKAFNSGEILNEKNYPEKIFGPLIPFTTVTRISLRLEDFEIANNLMPNINHVILHWIKIEDLTDILNKLNYMWPKLTSVTVHIRPDCSSFWCQPRVCPCCACSIDSVITGISDEALKSISNNGASGEKKEPEGVGTSILFQLKNLRSLTIIIPFCHFFSKRGRKKNLTAASIDYTLHKLPNLKVTILVDLSMDCHCCWDIYKLFEEFQQEFEQFSDHITVDTYLPKYL